MPIIATDTYTEREHGKELTGHEPRKVCRGDQRRQTEEQRLHGHRKGKLIVYSLDFMDKRRYKTATNKLTETTLC
jgi:hypothetical protein